MSNIDELNNATKMFFDRHWNDACDIGTSPAWTAWQPFLRGSVPNHTKSGCYALFQKDKLIYVGLGASRGSERYVEHGISRRLLAHVICRDHERGSEWHKLRHGWEHIDAIHTLGFESQTAYMAAAVETFLIRAIDGLCNARV